MATIKMRFDKPLTVSVENGVLSISIGIGLLAFAVQAPDATGWPSDFYIADIREFGREFAAELRREEEDGTTPVHRLFDKAATDLLETGAASVEEGDVQQGIAIARAAIGGSASPSGDIDAAPAVPPEHSWFSQAALDVTAERRRQIEVERRTDDSDDRDNRAGELIQAAMAYAANALARVRLLNRGAPADAIELMSKAGGVPDFWPWRVATWKPKDHRRNLVRAAALLIAEIERLDRAETRT